MAAHPVRYWFARSAKDGAAALVATLCTALGLLLVVTPAGGQPATSEPPPDQVILLPRIDVIGIKDYLTGIPGSADVIDRETLERSRVFTVNEALRKVPGVNVRDEEGLGLRPNIGIRGLNPTRSTKVTLMEDGVPLAYAPYGDNASYYHPPSTASIAWRCSKERRSSCSAPRRSAASSTTSRQTPRGNSVVSCPPRVGTAAISTGSSDWEVRGSCSTTRESKATARVTTSSAS